MSEDAHLTNMEKTPDDGTLPVGKFKIAKATLCSIAYACQERIFSEEVDILEELGGDIVLEDLLCTSYKHGLTGDDYDKHERISAYGHNKKPLIEPKSFCELVTDALEDVTMRILILAACASIIIDCSTAEPQNLSTAWIEGFAILCAVFISVSANAVNDYQKERQFQKLNTVADDRKRVTVLRGGQKIDLHQSEVLVGDIMLIFEGMEIPADGIVLEASQLQSDESAMTGETDPIKKNVLSECIAKRNQIIEEGGKNTAGHHDVTSCVMMSGTRVLAGEGKMLVIVVGDLSCVGKISALLRQDEPEATPLQMKLTAIAEDIGKFGLISAVCIVFVLLLRFAIERAVKQDWENSYVSTLLNYFIIGITVIVVAIPEGLPLAVTLSLALSTKQMLKDNNLVRKMAACETMGGASMICSDKTGTLTQNKMSLVSVWNDEIIEIDSYTKDQQVTGYFPKDFIEYFTQAAIVNASAMLRPEPKGSKTEIALLEFYERCGIDYEIEMERYPASARFPFSSARKRMSIVIELGDGRRRLVTKGASEMVLASCSQYHSKKGQVMSLSPELNQKVQEAISTMANRALRTICIAYKNISANQDLTSKDRLGVFDVETKDLVLLGVLGIKDILRQEVPRAIKLCRMAGIKVRMVTGDNLETARAIAKECGIIQQGDEQSLVLEGPEFIKQVGGVVCKKHRTYICECARDSQTAKKEGKDVRVDTIEKGDEFDKIYPKLDVLARSRPEDKYALVTGLIERGHVVAVTGDGTNDAPALKKADVGFAMGIAGTEVAREAAAIILLDDNFNSIVKAVMWGRNVYDNIKKFLRFQLTANVVSVSLTLIGAVVIQQEILRPIQLLWVNLIMDTLGSLALATDPPTEKLLNRKPHDRTEYIISKKMFKFILGTALVQLAIVLIIVFYGDHFLPEYADDLDAQDHQFGSDWSKFWKYSDSGCWNSYNMTKSAMNKEFPNCENTRCFCKSKDECGMILCKTLPTCDYQNTCTIVRSGRLLTPSGDNDYEVYWQQTANSSRHFTYIFNIFIMLQLFNFLNSRKITDELNIFDNISNHHYFYIIVPTIFAMQVLMITFGSKAIQLYPNYGLRPIQWVIGVGFGFISIVTCALLKVIRVDICCEFGSKEVDPLDANEGKIIALKGAHSHDGLKRRFSGLQQAQSREGIGLGSHHAIH